MSFLVPAAGEWPKDVKLFTRQRTKPKRVQRNSDTRFFPAVARIIDEVARETGFTADQIIGVTPPELKAARYKAYWRAATETGASLRTVAKAFGNRKHGSLRFGIRKHEARMKAGELGGT